MHVSYILHPAALVEIRLQLQQRLNELQLSFLERLVFSAVKLQLLSRLLVLLARQAALRNDVAAFSSGEHYHLGASYLLRSKNMPRKK